MEMFQKIFLKFAPTQRPLLLIQGGATAHTGPSLIDIAIRNDDVIELYSFAFHQIMCVTFVSMHAMDTLLFNLMAWDSFH